MPGKLPAIMLYTGDWLKDPALSMCSAATRGIWIDALCAMHESDRSGFLEGTPEQLSRCLRTTPSEVLSAVRELHATGAAVLTERNGVVTLINRRMHREHKERVNANLRQRRARGKPAVTPASRVCHDNVTVPLSSSSSISVSVSGKKEKPAGAGPTSAGGNPLRELTDHYVATWKKKYGRPYPFAKVDGVKCADLLRLCGGSVEDAKAAMDRYLADDGVFYQGHPIALLASASQLPRFIVEKGKKNEQQKRGPSRGITENLAL